MNIKALLSAAIMLCLLACQPENPFETSKEVSQPTVSHVAQSQDCRVCHSYPVTSKNDAHKIHMMTPGDTLDNGDIIATPKGGAITCLECHFGSVQSAVVFDTLAGDTSFLPLLQAGQQVKDRVYAQHMDIATLTSFIRAFRDSSAEPNQFPSLKTSLMHNNGVIDVNFSPDLLLTPFPKEAIWNPKTLTCSAIKCHGERSWVKE